MHLYSSMPIVQMSTPDIQSGFFASKKAHSVPVALDMLLKTIKHLPSTASMDEHVQAKAQLMLDCGGTATYKVYCTSRSGCKTVYDAPKNCGSRLCASCTLRSAKKLAAAWRYKLQDVPLAQMALLTLTLRITATDDLAAKYELAYDALRKLVRQEFFRRSVSGWVRKIEVKPAKKSGGWNVHIHMIVQARHERKVYRAGSGRKECDFYPPDGSLKLSRQTISDAWRKLTGSYRVDIIPIRADAGGAPGAIKYLLKYMTKLEGFSAETPAAARQILDYQKTMKGRRTMQAGGQFHAAHKAYCLRRPEKKASCCRSCGEKLTTDYQVHTSIKRIEKAMRVKPRYSGAKLTDDSVLLGMVNRLIPPSVSADTLASYGTKPEITDAMSYLAKKILDLPVDRLRLIC